MSGQGDRARGVLRLRSRLAGRAPHVLDASAARRDGGAGLALRGRARRADDRPDQHDQRPLHGSTEYMASPRPPGDASGVRGSSAARGQAPRAARRSVRSRRIIARSMRSRLWTASSAQRSELASSALAARSSRVRVERGPAVDQRRVATIEQHDRALADARQRAVVAGELEVPASRELRSKLMADHRYALLDRILPSPARSSDRVLASRTARPARGEPAHEAGPSAAPPAARRRRARVLSRAS